jgi:hypothetical protein
LIEVETMQRLQDPFWQRERLKFDESVIMSEVPKKAGVFALFTSDSAADAIYIGRGDDVQESLLNYQGDRDDDR